MRRLVCLLISLLACFSVSVASTQASSLFLASSHQMVAAAATTNIDVGDGGSSAKALPK